MQGVRRRLYDLTGGIVNDELLTDSRPTESVPEFGGFKFPLVMDSQIFSPGIISSVHRMVNKGASQRTMDEGSSNRMSRFSRLRTQKLQKKFQDSGMNQTLA
jgi:hypothetical protein